MIKYTIIISGIFAYSLAFGADLVVDKKTVPVRRFYLDGSRIPPQEIESVHKRDLDTNGWRWDMIEWDMLLIGRAPLSPKFRIHSKFGSNGGTLLSWHEDISLHFFIYDSRVDVAV